MVKSVLVLLLLSLVATQALQPEEGYETLKGENPEDLPGDVYTDEYYVDGVGSGNYEEYENYYGGDYENGKGNNYYNGVPANSDDEDNYGSGELASGDDEENYDDLEIVPEVDGSEKTTAADATTEKVVATSTPPVETKSSTSIIPKEEEGEIDVPTTSAPKAPQTPKRKHPHHKKNKEATEKKEEEFDIEVVEQQGSSFNLSDGHFLTAAIIGGCIGFLFAVALIMLLLYRMRKKDEGSFSLQDGKKKGGPPGYQYKQGTEYYA